MPVRFHFLPEAEKEESIGQRRHLPSHLYPLPAFRLFIYRLTASVSPPLKKGKGIGDDLGVVERVSEIKKAEAIPMESPPPFI